MDNLKNYPFDVKEESGTITMNFIPMVGINMEMPLSEIERLKKKYPRVQIPAPVLGEKKVLDCETICYSGDNSKEHLVILFNSVEMAEELINLGYFKQVDSSEIRKTLIGRDYKIV